MYRLLVIILLTKISVATIVLSTTADSRKRDSSRTDSDMILPLEVVSRTAAHSTNNVDLTSQPHRAVAGDLDSTLKYPQQALLKTVDDKDIYFSISKTFKNDKATLKSVISLILNRKISDADPYIPQPIKWMVDIMINIVQYMFNRMNDFISKPPDWWNPPPDFGKPLPPGYPPIGHPDDGFWDFVDFGIDDGKDAGSRTKLHTYKRWDISSDEAHLDANKFNDQTVIDDDLRDHMVTNGVKNLTFVHLSGPHPDIPLLVYRRDDAIHYHLRPSTGKKPPRRPIPSRKHFSYFDANGAGFKISLDVPADPTTKSTPFSKKGIKTVASSIAKDYFGKRQTASVVGYQEVDKKTNRIEARLCFIAEKERFNLDSETHLCFGKKEK
ncbi:hypothetical protein K461DRAFT_268217 [Myriangium duriaei CBS 260.36]|uniref:Uncharacterized protein n=1 Tax=Myriangium duriaei CBS 260.36 TaxID=1168546 RepID=A0A9P4MFD0_9PEZI|nr:hypothetical protein K461DRAFT_268217 [Myriangium duriaei CBS 260.36]